MKKITVSAEALIAAVNTLRAVSIDITQHEEELETAKTETTKSSIRLAIHKLRNDAGDARKFINNVARSAIDFMSDEEIIAFVQPRVTLVAEAASVAKAVAKDKAERKAKIELREKVNEVLGLLVLRDEDGNPLRDSEGRVILSAEAAEQLNK